MHPQMLLRLARPHPTLEVIRAVTFNGAVTL